MASGIANAECTNQAAAYCPEISIPVLSVNEMNIFNTGTSAPCSGTTNKPMITEKKNTSPAPAYLRILRCFDEHKEETLDRSVIVKEANLVNFSHYTHWNLARHNQYQLLVLHGTKYRIHPKVKIWWEHHM